MSRHLSYLSCVGLSFFDNAVSLSLDVNGRMVFRLNSPGKKKNLKRVAVARTKGDTTLKGRRAPPLVQEIENLPSSLDGLVSGILRPFLKYLVFSYVSWM